MKEKDDKAKITVLGVIDDKIVFKTSYEWAICLNASWYKKSLFFLPNNPINDSKIRRIFPKAFSFPEVRIKKSVSNINALREYQKEDVNFLSKLKSGGIFSEMRTGKTPVALFVWKKWGVKNLLIIVPSSLQYHWHDSLIEWLNQPSYIISYLDKADRYLFYKKLLQEDKGWVVITSRDKFKQDEEVFQSCKKKGVAEQKYCVILDEAHSLRNIKSQQSKSAIVLQDASYRLALTGTPIVNHHSDLFGILNFLLPQHFPSYYAFINRYFEVSNFNIYVRKTGKNGEKKLVQKAIQKINNFKTLKQRNELYKILGAISVNRRQKDILPWLPKVVYKTELLLMEKKQQTLYTEIKKERYDKPIIEVLTKLKTATLFPRALETDCNGSKVTFLINYLQENTEHSIIIFSTRTSTFLSPLSEILEEKGIKVELIVGETNTVKRQKIIKEFQNKEVKILLCNIWSAGLGIELSQADTAIFADRSYAPADNEQAEARFLPTKKEIKDNRPRLIIDLICKNSIDEKIHKLLANKENIIKLFYSKPEILLD